MGLKSLFHVVLKAMSTPSDLGVVPVRDENGNVVSYTVGRQSAPVNGDTGERGWVPSTRSAATGTVPEPDALSALRAYTRARVKARRRQAEEDGVIVDGVIYDTSDDAHLRLMTLLVFAVRDPDYTASMLIRDGSVKSLTSPEIYAVATAIANHMQACAKWEIDLLQSIEDAADIQALTTIEESIDDSAPSGDVTTPVAPDGSDPPPLYNDANFLAVTCETIDASSNVSIGGTLAVTGDTTLTGATALQSTLSVTGDTTLSAKLTTSDSALLQSTLEVVGTSLFSADVAVTGANLNVTGSFDVTEDATIERLYARDKLGMGTMNIIPYARSGTETWAKAGSFLWRRGDRQPTKATVSFAVTRSDSKAGALFFEVGRRVILGWGLVPNAGETIVEIPLSGTVFTQHDDTAYEIEVHIVNATESGFVYLSNYFMSMA